MVERRQRAAERAATNGKVDLEWRDTPGVRCACGRNRRSEARRESPAGRFAVFEELVNGRPVAYLDSAASTQAAPGARRDADFYEHSYANVHRGVYRLAEEGDDGIPDGRRKVAAFVNAPSEREVIFTRSATEALNLVAYAWGLDNLGPDDVVVVTELGIIRASYRGSTSRVAPVPRFARSRSTSRASFVSKRWTSSRERATSRWSPTTSSRTRSEPSIR